MANKEKALNLLTMCRRAGRLTIGFDASMENVKSGAAQAVVTAEDISPKTAKEALFISSRQGVPVLHGGIYMEELYHCFGKTVGIMAVCDKGFAAKLREYLDETISADAE